MINVALTVREALIIINALGGDIAEKITVAIEVASGINDRKTVVITKLNSDNRIQCIKALRFATGWGLKESKDWTDVLMGVWNSYRNEFVSPPAGTKNSVTLADSEAAEKFLRELTDLGCEGYLQ